MTCGQQQHHQEKQSSQSLGEDPFISSLHQLRASLHNCFSYYKIIKSRNSRTKKRGITIDEVVQIINNLGSRISFDVSQTFSDQKKSINKKLLPAVKAAMNPSIEVYDTEIVNVIKQLHKSRQDIWKITQDGKLDTHSRRQHMTSRRDQKMTRRKCGLQYMINTKDKVLNNCKPQKITWDEYMKDCEKIVVILELHSDKWSSEDENLANNEKNLEKRPERLDKLNSVIKIHEKKWQSTRVCKVISLSI
ncbi:unnamed protein product [Rhizophagus irregularis]|nr:unnamed protein product [Rhizophagus irregularis]